jgi:tryptophan synthase alpha chain
MNQRIEHLKTKRNQLAIYFTAGYPKLNDTLKLIQALEQTSTDLIEIGMPYSDPLADGPVIQEASQQAIENGMSVKLLFEHLIPLRTFTDKPVFLMGYLNPILQYGIEHFFIKCKEVGVDGLIIPDMPIAYYQKTVKPIAEKYEIALTFLITPQTKESRIREINEASNGFIYVVSSNSLTGSKLDQKPNQHYFNEIKNRKFKSSTFIGFGIHDQQTFQNASLHANGAIIGSAFIKHIQQNGISNGEIKKFVDDIKT